MSPLLDQLRARVTGVVIPPWAKYAAIGMLLAAVYGTGRLHEARRAADAHAEYVGKQAAQSPVIIKRQEVVRTEVEIKYVDRIKKIYIQGETIENSIPTYILPADIERFGVNVGFVRVLDAAWSGMAPGPAADTDRGAAGISLDAVAAAQAENATSCLAWREQVRGWRDFYSRQQIAINGKAGTWAASKVE